MAKYSNVVEYNIITDVDTSGITKLQNELTKLKQSLKFDGGTFTRLGLDNTQIDKSIKKINQLQTALTAAFNPKIGTLDLSKLNTSLQKEHTSLQMIAKDWERMGYRGQAAISSLSNALLSMNKGAVTVNTTLSKIANTFSNTVRWGITASIFQEMMSSIQGAVSYMKNLDESLTQIQMVTNSSKENMRELAQYANNAAQALGSTTVDYTNAVKVFVQEGFSESESKQYANLSTKLANVSEQSTAVTSDQITAFRNAFQLDYEQTVAAMDKVANVANNTASNVNELMTASQRAASVAQAVGASQDSFLASIATIESVTRQSAEEIGNGLKTIYQRFADIKVSGSTEDGVDYGQYAKALKQIGVDVLDAQGEFKGMDQILKETQEVWSGLSETMKVAVGEKVAGKFQYNRFAALMNNPEYYQKALGATQGAEGMMDQMNEYYMDSIEGRLKTLQAAGEQVMSTLFDQDTVEPIIEDVTKIVNGLNDMVDAAGGLSGVLTALSAIMLRTFSTQIAGTISNIASSIGMIVANSRNANQLSASVELLGLKNLNKSTLENSMATKLVTNVAPNYDSLSEKTREKIRDLSQQIVELEDERVKLLQEQERVIGEIRARALGEKEIIDAKLKSQGTLYVERKKELELQLQTGKITKQQYSDEIETIHSSLLDLGKKRNLYNQIEKAVIDYNKKIAEGKTLEEQDVQELLKMKEAARGLGINVEELDKILRDMGINIQNLNLADKIIGDTTKMTTFEAKVNGMVKTLSSVTSIAFGFSMISEAISTVSDESASLEEKLSAITMNGLMGLTMLLPGIVQLTTQMRELTLAYLVQTGEIKANSSAQEINNALKSGGIALTIEAIAVRVGEIAGLIAYTIAETAANTVRAIRNFLNGGWLNIAGAVVVVAGALVIAISGIANAWIQANDGVVQANKNFQEQNDLLLEIKRSYKDVTENLETLKTSMDKIHDSKDTLKDLEEGTLEWKEAVVSLNQEVLNLLETYPQLVNFLSNENGVLSISDEGLDTIYNEQLNKARSAQNMVTIQQARIRNTNSDLAIANFAREHRKNFGELSVENVKEVIDNINNGSITIKDACKELGLSIEKNGTDITKLAETVQSNTVAADALNTTFGETTEYLSFASNPNSEESYQNAYDDLEKKYGSNVFNQGGFFEDSAIIAALDNREKIVNQQDFKDIVQGAIPDLKGSITSIEEAANNWNWVIKTTANESIEIAKQDLHERMALYQAEQDIEHQMLEENKKVYEAFGVEWDNELNKPKNELSKDNQAALDAFLNNESFKQALQKYYPEIDTVEEFANAINKGIVSVDGLSEALDKLTPQTVDLTHNINGNEFTNRIDISSDEDSMKKLLDDSGMSQSAFNRMSRDAYEEEQGYYQQEKKALEELIAKRQEDGEVTEWEAEQINKFNAKIEDLDDAAKDTTAMILRMSNGVVKLRNNIEDISEVLTNEAFRGTTEWYEALDDLDAGLSEVLNIDAGTLSDEFIESGDALDYARRMAEGDMSAIDDLRKAASEDIVKHLSIQVDPTEDVDAIRAELMSELNQLQADIDAGKITIATDLDTYPFIQKLNEMLAQGKISAEQASQILSSIGMEANIKYAEGDGEVDAIEYRPTISMNAVDIENPITGGTLLSIPGIKMEPSVTKVPTKTKIPYLEGTHYTGPGVQTANTAARNPNYTGGYSKNPTPKKSGSGKSPSSGSKQPKNNQKKDKETSQWDYLTDITNDLDRAAAAMEKLAKLEDRLYGANRISQLKKLRTEYKNYIKLLQQEVKLAEKHAEKLRTNAKDENGNLTINGYAYRAGINQLKFDAQNNLENGREIEQALLSRVNNAVATYNQHRNDEDTGKYEWDLNQAKSDYDGFLKAMSEYEDTLGKIEDGQSAIQDYKEKIQDAADEIVDAIQQGIEDMIETIDNQRNFNKLYRDWMQGGNSYSHFDNDRRYYAEGLQGLLSSNPYLNGKSLFDVQIQNLSDRIADAKNIFDKDSSNADNKKLSEQAAFENLQEATTNIMDSLNKMIDYYDSLLSTIEEASSKMDELIDGRLEEFDKLENYLDTRLDQLKLIFGDKSYEQQTQFYNQKIATNMEKMVSINTALEAKQVTVKTLEKLEETGKQLSTEERKELQNTRDKVNELQEEQLNTETNLLQDIANKLKAQTSAEMTNLVNELFGGNDVEWLSQQWEIATRNSEKYYDDYNRAFELQKLQLKFQKALNDNQNSSLAAQQKINDLANEYLTYLREKDKLSEYDVKHAQMQLDILQKQIALEDARNNKSQMRLQRNAAGNYDFVYAADENAVNQATEALLAAQQEAYNLSKQKYLETYEAAYQAALQTRDMVVEIATDASLSVEERSERIQEILDGLNEYLSGSSVELSEISINLYNSFVDAETMVLEENQGNLSAIFEQMRIESEALQSEIEDNVGTAASNIENSVNIAAANVGNAVNSTVSNIQNKVNEVEKEFGDKATGLQATLSSAFETMSTNSIGSFNALETRITGQGGILEKIKVGSIDTSNGINTHINNIIGKIDKRFTLSRDNALLKITDIDTKIHNATQKITGSNGYLENFESSTKQTLNIAGDSYKRFTEEGIDYAAEQLKELKDATNDWKSDLALLNTVITNSATEMTTWKGKITDAITESDKFITTSNSMQAALEGNGIMASIASSAFDTLSGSANTLESSVQSMANTLENSYYSIAGAASTAAAAYSDMASAAYEAGNAAQWAANELASLSGYDPTYFDVSDAVNQVRRAIGNTASSVANAITRNFKTKSSSTSDYLWDGYTYSKWDTGGYTGTWSDKGIDSKNGKLAILHQKELVLNAEDTKNMLSAVEIVRDIMSGINTLPFIGKTLGQNSLNNNTIEQRVEISATFPGVTEAIEIKQALEQIADNAYQVANKYKY